MRGTLWITGVSGFTGRHLTAFIGTLSKRPHVVGFDIVAKCPGEVDAFHQVDLTAPAAVATVARADRPTWVIHLAGVMPPTSEESLWRANVAGTLGLLQGLRDGGCTDTRVLSIGSAAEYMPVTAGALTEESACGGLSEYGRSKWAQTTLTLALGAKWGLSVLVARPFNLVGPGLPATLVPGHLCEQFARGEAVREIVVGNTASARDFVDVRDAVAAYWLLVQRGAVGLIYNVCTGIPMRVTDLIQLFSRASGTSPCLCTDPALEQRSDAPTVYGDAGRLRAAVAWRPRISLEQSVTDMLAFVRSRSGA